MILDLSPDFIFGSVIGGFGVLTSWVFSLSNKVNTLAGRFEEHVKTTRR